MKDGELLLRVEDAATELGLSRAKTYELVMSGRIRSIKIDRSRRVPRAALEQWVEDQLEDQEQGTDDPPR